MQASILSRFDIHLLSCIKVVIKGSGITYELFGDRQKLKKLGFLFREDDEFLPRSQFEKLRPLLNDQENFLAPSPRRKKGTWKPSQLASCFAFSSYATTRQSFFTAKPLWLKHSVSLSLAVSTAFEALAFPMVGHFFTFRSATIVREGSSVRGVLASHYLRMFRHLDLPIYGDDTIIIKTLKASLYKFLVRACHKYQRNAVLPIVDQWPRTITFNIMPRASWSKTEKKIRSQYNLLADAKIVQLAYCIAQSKALCERVSDSFVLDSLRSHKSLLCHPEERTLDSDVVSMLERVGDEFGQVVSRFYNPFLTVPPNSSACFERNRRRGGLLKHLESNYSSPPKSSLRCEPLVVGLFGPPGSGKTSFLYKLLRHLRDEFFFPEGDDGVYFRNPHLDHWDGYRGQFITVIDDFGQDLGDSPDLCEFDQMVSCGTFYPPMANLSEKGIKFTSTIIILTSNLTFGQRLVNGTGEPILADPLSVWRRIHLPFVLFMTESRYRDLVDISNDFKKVSYRGPGHFLDSVPDWRLQEETSRIGVDPRFSAIDSVSFGSPLPDEDCSTLFFKILPNFNRQFGWVSNMTNGLYASVRKHLPVFGDPPVGMEFLGSESIMNNLSVGEVSLCAHPADYDRTDARNTGLNIIGYSLSSSSEFQILRETVSKYYQRREFHHQSMGVWTQTVVDQYLDSSASDFPDEDDEAIRQGRPWVSDGHARCDVPRLWKSRVPTDTSVHVVKKYYFPASPPVSPPKVKTVGLPEPLKCRVITVPEGQTRCLKPFQMAMCRSLSYFPQFSLTHSSYWDMEGEFTESNSVEAVSASLKALAQQFLSRPDRLCLSGDYRNATDNFIMEVSRVLLKAILRHIPHIPTRKWAMWEISPALISYPFGTFLQTRGQRMGSILSFPLLCLANEALCRLSGFDPGSYLINGDDLAAGVSVSSHLLWKQNGIRIGLEPNEKYFISSGSRKIIFINSQLFDVSSNCLLPSGKLSCMTRRDKPLASCLEYLQRYYRTSVLTSFVRLNHDRLRSTPCSPYIPTSFGGLAYEFYSSFHLEGKGLSLGKAVYIVQLWRRLWRAPLEVPGTQFSLVSIPYLVDDLHNGRENRLPRGYESWDDVIIARRNNLSARGFARAAIDIQNGREPTQMLFPCYGRLGSERVIRDPLALEFLMSGDLQLSPWFFDFLDEYKDPNQELYITLCKYYSMKYCTDEELTFEDLPWFNFKKLHSEILDLLSPMFKHWFEKVEKIFHLRRFEDFRTRYLLVHSKSAVPLSKIVLREIEKSLMDSSYSPSTLSYWEYRDELELKLAESNTDRETIFLQPVFQQLAVEPTIIVEHQEEFRNFSLDRVVSAWFQQVDEVRPGFEHGYEHFRLLEYGDLENSEVDESESDLDSLSAWM